MLAVRPGEKIVSDRQALIQDAQGVLDRNWTGASTIPSRSLYPHQWSWDAAFIAIGRSWQEQRRAEQDLETLLAAQWASGMVPHIVFNPAVPAGAYFPGPEFWDSAGAAGHPNGPATSGLTQPPLHALAALEVHRRAQDPGRARAFLERVYPRLAAQHDYLARRRDPAGHGLAVIVHPWESGMDNAPVWDEDLELAVPPGAVPPYRRHDLVNADPGDRPTQAAYDRFVYLAITYRDKGYDDSRLLAGSPFLVEDPLFNSIWCASAHAPAEIVPAGYVDAIIADLRSEHFRPADPGAFLVPSSDLVSPEFDRRRYWRGPVWINTDWLVWRGLMQHPAATGGAELAAEIAASMVRLVSRSGWREYFDPFTGAGYGSADFSWSAALVIDLLRTLAADQGDKP